jgi:hypothetical protein
MAIEMRDSGTGEMSGGGPVRGVKMRVDGLRERIMEFRSVATSSVGKSADTVTSGSEGARNTHVERMHARIKVDETTLHAFLFVIS